MNSRAPDAHVPPPPSPDRIGPPRPRGAGGSAAPSPAPQPPVTRPVGPLELAIAAAAPSTPTGLAIAGTGRMFVMMPRFTGAEPVTLGEVMHQRHGEALSECGGQQARSERPAGQPVPRPQRRLRPRRHPLGAGCRPARRQGHAGAGGREDRGDRHRAGQDPPVDPPRGRRDAAFLAERPAGRQARRAGARLHHRPGPDRPGRDPRGRPRRRAGGAAAGGSRQRAVRGRPRQVRGAPPRDGAQEGGRGRRAAEEPERRRQRHRAQPGRRPPVLCAPDEPTPLRGGDRRAPGPERLRGGRGGLGSGPGREGHDRRPHRHSRAGSI